MLNHMNSMTDMNDLVILRIKASSTYLSSKIHNETNKQQFNFVIEQIQNVLKTCSNEQSFDRAKKMLVRLEAKLDDIREPQSDLSALFNPRYKYDHMAFDLAKEAIDKIEMKFIRGYSG